MSEQPTARVTFSPGGAVDVRRGSVLLAAALAAGFPVHAECGGRGTCGKCAVTATGGLSDPSGDERILLAEADLAAGTRLACRARVVGDVAVSAASAARAEAGTASDRPQILAGSDVRATYEVEPPEECAESAEHGVLGMACDVGTTTLAAALVDLCSGDILATATALNPQARFGADVMSRIAVSGEYLEDMSAELISALEEMFRDAISRIGSDLSQVRRLSVAGNTTMMHLLMEVDPATLGRAPYEPAFTGGTTLRSDAMGFPGLPDAEAYVLPSASAFIGGDVIADLLATGLDETEKTTLLVDLGTNGEIVLKTAEKLHAASAAAGPALEGATLECGMHAATGAIEHAAADDAGDLVLSTIGGAEPRGICGSGLLDLVALLLDAGVIDSDGAMTDEAAGPLAARVTERDDQRVFVVDEQAGLVLTQKDVREVQLAKGAVRSAIDVLLTHAGLAHRDVEEVLVAGGFGLSVSPDSLVRTGMIPAEWRGRIRFVGNTALEGARAALTSSAARLDASRIAEQVSTVPLSSDPEFRNIFMSALNFPSTGS